MRIIAGKAKGRRLKVPSEDVRPTTDRTREALFSILGSLVESASVCDLFAGSGSLGLEAMSRGAKDLVQVEAGRHALKALRANVSTTQLPSRIVSGDVFDFLKRDIGTYDLIFADPPYERARGERSFINELLMDENLPLRLADEGLLMIEAYKDAPVPPSSTWRLVDDRKYGVCRILFFRKSGVNA